MVGEADRVRTALNAWWEAYSALVTGGIIPVDN